MHPEDNADLSSTTLAIVLHNDHYSSEDILPRQNTGTFDFGIVKLLSLPVSVSNIVFCTVCQRRPPKLVSSESSLDNVRKT